MSFDRDETLSKNLQAAKQSYDEPYPHWGFYTCPRCPARRKHRLTWPTDAYYAVEIRGKVLWAWDRRQSISVRNYLASKDRELKKTGLANPDFWFLRIIPKHFLLVKHRDEAVKKLDLLLANT